VAEVAGPHAALKWPNDVLLDGRKVAGILVEGRPQEGWAVLGIGVNVAVRDDDFPPELRATAGSLGLEPDAVEGCLTELLARLERWLAAPGDAILGALNTRDALRGRRVRWAGGSGAGAGVDSAGRLLVQTESGVVALDAGEVHLER
jgi:BirA family biotin operon repressor/biotin-[acetyl-CoA-carboxylase] ligase